MVAVSEGWVRVSMESGSPVRAHASPPRRGPIVLAVDGTECGASAIVQARMLAAQLDLPLEVITVIEPTPIRSASPDETLSTPAIDDAQRHVRETAVSDYVCRFSGGAAPARVHVRVGSVTDEIDRFARDVFATIVVRAAGIDPTHA
jgi:hypothetical protein